MNDKEILWLVLEVYIYIYKDKKRENVKKHLIVN